VNAEPFDERARGIGEIDQLSDGDVRPTRSGPLSWLRNTNQNPDFVAFLRRA
jgi:hypothetical protein